MTLIKMRPPGNEQSRGRTFGVNEMRTHVVCPSATDVRTCPRIWIWIRTVCRNVPNVVTSTSTGTGSEEPSALSPR